MKSNKQRRVEIMQRRVERARQIEAQLRSTTSGRHLRLAGMEPVNRAVLARYNASDALLPEYYLDRVFRCRDCGIESVWTAKQQKWWYEVMHSSTCRGATRCLSCRRAYRAHKRSSQAGEGANLLAEKTQRLRALGKHAPDDAAWIEIETALQSKWWSQRRVALQVLSRWGGPRALQYLKQHAQMGPANPNRSCWEHVGSSTAIQLLGGGRLPQADLPWALEAYLVRYCSNGKQYAWHWWPLLNALSLVLMQHAASAELARGEATRLMGFLELLRLPGNHALVLQLPQSFRQRLLTHEQGGVRMLAQKLWRAPD